MGINVNNYMNEYDPSGRVNDSHPLYMAGYTACMKDQQERQQNEKRTALTMEVSVTDIPIFTGVLDTLMYLFQKAEREDQENAWRRIEQLLGETHDLTEFREERLE